MTWWILPSPTDEVLAKRLPWTRVGVTKLGRAMRGVVRDERATRAALAKLALLNIVAMVKNASQDVWEMG